MSSRPVVLKIKRKPCGFKSCGAEPAPYSPELVIRTGDGSTVTVELQLNVCERCRRFPKAAFLSGDGMRHLNRILRDNNYRTPASVADIVLQFRTEKGLIVPHGAAT